MSEVKKYDWSLAEDVLTKLAVYTKLTNAKRLKKMTVGDVAEYQKAANLLDDIVKNPGKYFKDNGSFDVDLFAFSSVYGQGGLYHIYANVFNTIASWHRIRVANANEINYMNDVLESFSVQLDERIKIARSNPLVRVFKEIVYKIQH